jgi:archaellum component FlaC
MQQEIDQLKAELEITKKNMGVVIHLLENIRTVVENGFNQVNSRLANLEGKNGMQGVNEQLGGIKSELQKIQMAYPYDDIVSNMNTVSNNKAQA